MPIKHLRNKLQQRLQDRPLFVHYWSKQVRTLLKMPQDKCSKWCASSIPLSSLPLIQLHQCQTHSAPFRSFSGCLGRYNHSHTFASFLLAHSPPRPLSFPSFTPTLPAVLVSDLPRMLLRPSIRRFVIDVWSGCFSVQVGGDCFDTVAGDRVATTLETLACFEGNKVQLKSWAVCSKTGQAHNVCNTICLFLKIMSVNCRHFWNLAKGLCYVHSLCNWKKGISFHRTKSFVWQNLHTNKSKRGSAKRHHFSRFHC